MEFLMSQKVASAKRWVKGGELIITSPLPDVWRIQTSAQADGGAIQKLAELTGETPEGVFALQQLFFADDVISTSAGYESVQLFASSDTLKFIDRNENDVLEVTGVNQEEDQTRFEFGIMSNEAFFGTGERFNGVNQRGKKVTIWAEDRWCHTEVNSYLPIPFVLSSQHYAVPANRFEASIFDLGNTSSDHWSLTRFDTPMDVYFVFGKEPAEIYAKLVKLWGKAVVPPDWSWGMFVSRHLDSGEFAKPEGIREMAMQMEAYDLPWDVVLIEGWDTFNTDTYCSLKEITTELLDKNKKVMVYEACGRLSESYWKSHNPISDYFICDKNGNREIEEASHFNPADAPDRRNSSFLDITNPKAIIWWWEKVWRPLVEELGISGAKIDFCEQIPEGDDLVLSSGRSIKGMHHLYPVQYNLMMFELFNRYAADGGLCWSRGGSIGAHLYPFVWSGDQLREFRFLKAILSAILSSGISGVPFMGHDFGGYLPAENGDKEADVFVRGAQFSCFTATMSTHGKVTRPYDFSSPYVDIYRFYSKVRNLLRPYIKEQAEICSQTGLPLVRYLYLHHPNDRDFLYCEDQYMFGEDLLVAPVLENACERSIILPEGTWYSLFDAKEYNGKTVLENYSVPLETIPVFVAVDFQSKVLGEIIDQIQIQEF